MPILEARISSIGFASYVTIPAPHFSSFSFPLLFRSFLVDIIPFVYFCFYFQCFWNPIQKCITYANVLEYFFTVSCNCCKVQVLNLYSNLVCTLQYYTLEDTNEIISNTFCPKMNIKKLYPLSRIFKIPDHS